MEKKDIALFIAAFISLTSIILANQIPDSNLRVDPPKTVAYVDINLYLGEWYEEALIPYFWEKGDCTEGRAIYTLESDKKTIKVDNRCVRNGKETSTIGKAVPED